MRHRKIFAKNLNNLSLVRKKVQRTPLTCDNIQAVYKSCTKLYKSDGEKITDICETMNSRLFFLIEMSTKTRNSTNKICVKNDTPWYLV